MDEEQIYLVLTKLIGKVDPAEDAAIDSKRLENMELFIKVFDLMHTKIDDIAYKHKDSRYASAKRIGEICDEHLIKIGIKE